VQEREKEEEKEKEKEKSLYLPKNNNQPPQHQQLPYRQEEKKKKKEKSLYLPKNKNQPPQHQQLHITIVDLSLTIITMFPTSHKPLKKAQQLFSSSIKTNTDNLF
jgi:hypothetical protein